MQMAHWSTVRLIVPSSRWRKPNSIASTIVSTDRPVAMSSGRFAEDGPAEQRLVLVRGLQGGEQAEEREGGHAHRAGDHVAVLVAPPREHAERAGGHDEPDEHEPAHQAAGDDLLLLGPRRDLHEALARLAVAEADGLEHVDGEVEPHGLERQERDAAHDVEERRAEERGDVPEQARHLEADEAQQVVVDGAPQADRLHDRAEVVVGEDHHRGLLGDLRAGDAHGDADVGLLERRRVVHAVAGHGDDVALLAQDVHEVDLVLGGDAGEDADAVDLAHRLVVAQGAEVGAGHGAALDAQLAGDRLGRDRVVAGDHADLDAGRMGGRDGGLGGRSRRVHDAHDREERQPVQQRQQVRVRVERGRVEVLVAGRHDPQALRAQALVLGEVVVAELCDRALRAVGAVRADGAGEELVRRALDVAADDVLARVVRHAVEGGHHLVGRVERQGRHARVALAGERRVHAALRGEDDERALGRVADERAVADLGVGAQGHRQQVLLERARPAGRRRG